MTWFLIHWLIVAVGLAAAAYLVPGVTIASGTALAVGALALGFVNAVVRPVMTLLTLPLTVLTFAFNIFMIPRIWPLETPRATESRIESQTEGLAPPPTSPTLVDAAQPSPVPWPP